MAPLLDDGVNGSDGESHRTFPRFLIIGAGSRGNAYARAVTDSGMGTIAAVSDPIEFKRRQLGSRYVWPRSQPSPEQEFSDWRDFIKYEQRRRKDEAAGHPTTPGVDGMFICVLDEQHAEAITALAPLGLAIMSEKPLATTLKDCLNIQRSLQQGPEAVFAIGHVLRYSPHNMLLRHLLLEQRVIGDVLSIEHTEPVGWWHFSHSYVRGNWRKESTTAPSLLTKSCHDIDFLLWLLCSPVVSGDYSPHLPSHISSTGSLKLFKRDRKPKEAGKATNCLSCPIKEKCMYSAERIYRDRHLRKGKVAWPLHIVNPEIESLYTASGPEAAEKVLIDSLAEDYDSSTPAKEVESRPWFGRCVWESDNDVCDDQYVTIEWADKPLSGQKAKTANFHMIANSLAQCERRGRIYGASGEISYDTKSITVHDFTDDTTRTYNPEVPKNSHHGGGDDGLAQQFVRAVAAAKEGKRSVMNAQVEFLGCTMEEVVRSHAAVFAAEDARRERRVIDWEEWWRENVENGLQ